MSPEPLLEARKIVKSFGRVQALNGANFTVHPREVVALVGESITRHSLSQIQAPRGKA